MVTQAIICGARGFSLCPRQEYQEIFSLSYIARLTKAAFNSHMETMRRIKLRHKKKKKKTSTTNCYDNRLVLILSKRLHLHRKDVMQTFNVSMGAFIIGVDSLGRTFV